MKILLVDDDNDMLALIESFIKREEEKFEVYSTKSPYEALEWLESIHFDIIVSDYLMPEMDGLNFLRTLRVEKNNTIPFIIFTGRGAEEVAMEALNLKANRYIQKTSDLPTQLMLLIDAIKHEVAYFKAMKKIKINEKILRESEEKLRLVLNNLPYSVILHDLEGKIIFANTATLNILQYTENELLQLTIRDIDEGSISRKDRDKIWHKLEKGEFTYLQSFLKRKNGSSFPVEVSISKTELKEEPVIIGIIQDLSVHKSYEKEMMRSREQLQHFIELLPEIVFETDEKLNIVYCNDITFSKFGYTKEDLQKGINIFHLIPERDHDRTKENIQKRINGELGKQSLEYSVIKKDGTELPVLINSKPIIEEKEFKGLRGVIIDIAELKKIQEEKEFLNSLVTHDIRNKIVSLQGYTKLLKDLIEKEECCEDCRVYIEKTKNNIEKIIELIEKLETYRRIEKEEKRTVNINSVLGEVKENVESLLKEKNIVLEVLEEETKENNVLAGELLNEVIENVIENAITHSNCSLIRVTITHKGRLLKCVIEDNGEGIKEEVKKNLFTKRVTTRSETHIGYGLFLVKKILQMYGGDIIPKVSLLGGAKFEINLIRKNE